MLATRTLTRQRPRTAARARRRAALGLTAKDMILGAIGRVGVDGGVGHVVEYGGDAIRALSMEQRLTVCNMSIEWGARAGMIAPDETTFAVSSRELAPKGLDWERALDDWRSLASDPGAEYDRHVVVDVGELARRSPGDEPRHGRPGDGVGARSASFDDPDDRAAAERALAYMDLGPASGSRRSASTASSSGRARTRASRTCARPRPSSRADASTRG